jgi:stage II sporulation protein E
MIKNEIPDVLSEILDKDIVYDYSVNRRKDDQDYNYSYTEEYPYKLSIGLSRCCKEEYSYSGDNISNIILSNGMHMIALCDGMGSGSVASHQSSRVLYMLEELVISGCDENSAINIINSILVLEEGEEIFSTLDLFLFDLNKCVGEFVKAGASPTYIRRGYDIEKIDFDTLPVGILEDIHIHTGVRNFKRGDFIYFMSDGFLDSIMNDETYLMQQMLQYDYRNPQKIADALFEDALRFSSGKAVDDITIMVIKIR